MQLSRMARLPAAVARDALRGPAPCLAVRRGFMGVSAPRLHAKGDVIGIDLGTTNSFAAIMESSTAKAACGLHGKGSNGYMKEGKVDANACAADDWIEAAFALYDKDSDGYIDKEAAFAFYDNDCNGYIDEDEFRNVLPLMGEDVQEEKLEFQEGQLRMMIDEIMEGVGTKITGKLEFQSSAPQ